MAIRPRKQSWKSLLTKAKHRPLAVVAVAEHNRWKRKPGPHSCPGE